MKGKLVVVVLAASMLGALGVGAAAAKAPHPAKKKPAAAAKKTKPAATCQLGEDTRKAPCAPNPLFSKDVCDDYLSQVRALAAPGTTITTAGNRYGPFFGTVGCYYTANGTPQRFYFDVEGGPNFHTNSLTDVKKQIDLQQAFEEEYQQWVTMAPASSEQCDPRDPVPTAPGTVKTTIEGYEAFTVDTCAPIDNNVVLPGGGRLEVLAGDTWVIVAGGGPSFGSLTSSQLIPFAEALIAKYH